MSIQAHYQPPKMGYCQGRQDTPHGACLFQILQPLNLIKPLTEIKIPAFCLLGFRCDEGVRRNFGRIGAIDGPQAIREMIARLPIQKSGLVCYDAGDIHCLDGNLESAQAALSLAVAQLIKANLTPIILGGGHELAWGHYQGIAHVFPNEQLGIVNFDAHFDMRPLIDETKGSSGTPFLQIANAHAKAERHLDYNCIGIQPSSNILPLFDTAKKYEVGVITADELHQGHLVKCLDFVNHVIEKNDLLYVSLCLDVLAAPYAPGVSAPQALGILPAHLMPLLRQLAASGKVISYDIAEMCPQYDSDQRTAKLAASFVFEILHHHMTR